MENIQEIRDKIRHSAAHLLAEAVLKFYPQAKLNVGQFFIKNLLLKNLKW